MRGVQSPDPFRPGQFFTVRNPEAILESCHHVGCPICNKLLTQLEQQVGFALIDPDSTLPFHE